MARMTKKNELNGPRTITRAIKQYPKFTGLLDIIIRAKGVELTERLRDAVETKIGRVRQYAPRSFRARVHFEREHTKAAPDQFCVKVRYEIPGNDLVAEQRAAEPLTALDLVSEKIERRLRKRKTARLASRLGRRARACRIAEFCESQPGTSWRGAGYV
jgi:ribosomal subunit interface protein